MVIELRSEEHEHVAQLLKALLDTGHLQQFHSYMEDEHNRYHCQCHFEEDILNFERKNRWCGAAEGWFFVLGRANDTWMTPCPEYTGYIGVTSWLEYEYDSLGEYKHAVVVIEEGYGMTVWDAQEFYDKKEAHALVRVPLAEDSAIHLNLGYKLYAMLESLWTASQGDGKSN